MHSLRNYQSMGLLTSEADLTEERPGRRFRDLLRRPRWRLLALTALLFTLSVFAASADATRLMGNPGRSELGNTLYLQGVPGFPRRTLPMHG